MASKKWLVIYSGAQNMSELVVLKQINSNGIAEITLNRPHVFNGYNEELLTAFRTILDELKASKAVRAMILRGAGKHFSAGADLNWFKSLAKESDKEKKRCADLSVGAMRELFEIPIPTIALIQNGCFGGGVGYASGCDVVIASEDAHFAITEVRVGITPAPILSQVVAAIGARQARRYATTAETFNVQEARRIGLVHEICPVGKLDEAAKPIIDAILRSAPMAVSDTKRLINEVGVSVLDDKLADRLALISASGRVSSEGIEGFSAYLEKRDPNWYQS
jgi:methylglutaconyl-CoA hydratase